MPVSSLLELAKQAILRYDAHARSLLADAVEERGDHHGSSLLREPPKVWVVEFRHDSDPSLDRKNLHPTEESAWEDASTLAYALCRPLLDPETAEEVCRLYEKGDKRGAAVAFMRISRENRGVFLAVLRENLF